MPVTTQNIKRTHALKISVTPAVYQKLLFVSETLGISPAQIAAMALSEYVTTKAIAFTAAQATSERVIEAMTPHMADLFQAMGQKQEN